MLENIDVNTIGSVASIAGVGVSIAQWFQGLTTERRKQLQDEKDATIDDYLEWLRRRDQQELVERLEESRAVLKSIRLVLKVIMAASEEQAGQILEKLMTVEAGLTEELSQVRESLDEIKAELRFFTAQPVGHEFLSFESRYLEKIEEHYDRLRMIGIPEMRDVTQSLSIAYVSLTLTAKTRGDDSDSDSAERLLLENHFLTVRGPAGCGKTTLLRWLAGRCAAVAEENNPWSNGIPFFIRLRSLPKESEGVPELGKLVDYTIPPATWAVEVPNGWINDTLSKGRAVLLVDGVDELAPSARAQFWDWVGEFLEAYSNNRMYITSRVFPDTSSDGKTVYWAPPACFSTCSVDELSDKDITAFVRHWHEAVSIRQTDPELRAEVRAAQKALPAQLSDPSNRRIRELCRTPLLCAMICAVHWKDEQYLPSRRIDLYQRCCAMLIDERDAKRQIPTHEGPLSKFDLRDKELVLQRLALEMVRNATNGADGGQAIEAIRADVELWVEMALPSCGNAELESCSGGQVLDFLIERTSIIREATTGFIDFHHRTFQEYLAACAAGAQNAYGQLVNHVSNDQWHETIVLAAGTPVGGVPFGNSLMRKLLELGKSSSSESERRLCCALAVACLDTAIQVDPQLRSEVLANIDDLLPPTDEIEAKAIAPAGNTIVPKLSYYKWFGYSYQTIAACARTLALIGTEEARSMLLGPYGYGGDTRATVQVEICKCPGVHPLDIPKIREWINWYPHRLSKAVTRLLGDVTHIEPLRGIRTSSLHLYDFLELVDISAVANSKLIHCSLHNCRMLEDLTPLESVSFDNMTIFNLPKAKRISLQTIRQKNMYSQVVVASCPSLESIAIKNEFDGTLVIRNCKSLAQLEEVSPSIQRLLIEKIDALPLTELQRFSSLRALYLINTTSLDTLDRIPDSQSMTELIVAQCNNLVELGRVQRFSQLVHLTLSDCANLMDVASLAELPNLEWIKIEKAHPDLDLSPIQHLLKKK